ncbi:MAG: YafY family protein [Litorimonas sp.]
MKRTDRLFEILQIFRERGFVRASELADALEVSTRTIYRDLDTLIASGHPIEGERGVGYLLREPIFLPPLSLTPEEASVLRLGMDMVRSLSDGSLETPARSVLGKLSSNRLSSSISHYAEPAPLRHIARLRDAVERRDIMMMAYLSLDGTESEREVRPLQVEHWQNVWTLTAWCELRDGFRTFRVDRIATLHAVGRTFPPDPDRSYEAYLALVGAPS